MKLLLLIFISAVVSGIMYVFFLNRHSRSGKHKKQHWKALSAAVATFFMLLTLIGVGMYTTAQQPDLQCTSVHPATSVPPISLNTAMDYFNQGNYDYDVGKCLQAVVDYTRAIIISPNYAQAYNNRAYTNMRLRNYKDALPDLDEAIRLNPNYIQALMNRGDIHNYYYQIDRQAAILDYKRVIALTGSRGGNTSVCGHLLLAKHNGWNVDTLLDLVTGAAGRCD